MTFIELARAEMLKAHQAEQKGHWEEAAESYFWAEQYFIKDKAARTPLGEQVVCPHALQMKAKQQECRQLRH